MGWELALKGDPGGWVGGFCTHHKGGGGGEGYCCDGKLGWVGTQGRKGSVCVCVWWVRGQHISVPASGCWLHKLWLVGVGCL